MKQLLLRFSLAVMTFAFGLISVWLVDALLIDSNEIYVDLPGIQTVSPVEILNVNLSGG